MFFHASHDSCNILRDTLLFNHLKYRNLHTHVSSRILVSVCSQVFLLHPVYPIHRLEYHVHLQHHSNVHDLLFLLRFSSSIHHCSFYDQVAHPQLNTLFHEKQALQEAIGKNYQYRSIVQITPVSFTELSRKDLLYRTKVFLSQLIHFFDS